MLTKEKITENNKALLEHTKALLANGPIKGQDLIVKLTEFACTHFSKDDRIDPVRFVENAIAWGDITELEYTTHYMPDRSRFVYYLPQQVLLFRATKQKPKPIRCRSVQIAAEGCPNQVFLDEVLSINF